MVYKGCGFLGFFAGCTCRAAWMGLGGIRGVVREQAGAHEDRGIGWKRLACHHRVKNDQFTVQFTTSSLPSFLPSNSAKLLR